MKRLFLFTLVFFAAANSLFGQILIHNMEGTYTADWGAGNWGDSYGTLVGANVAYSTSEHHSGANSLILTGTYSASGNTNQSVIAANYIVTYAGANWKDASNPPTISFWVKSNRTTTAQAKIGIEEMDGTNTDIEQWDLKDANAITLSTTWTQYTIELNTTNLNRQYTSGTVNGTLDLTKVFKVRFIVLRNTESADDLAVYFDDAYRGKSSLNLVNDMEGPLVTNWVEKNWGDYYGSFTSGNYLVAYNALDHQSGSQCLKLNGNYSAQADGAQIVGQYIRNDYSGVDWTGTPKISFWVKASAATTARAKIGIVETYSPYGGTNIEQWDLKNSRAPIPTTEWVKYTYELNSTNFERTYNPDLSGNNTLDLTNVTRVRFIAQKADGETNSDLSILFDDATISNANINVINDMEGTFAADGAQGNWGSYQGDLVSKNISYSSVEHKVGAQSLQIWGNFTSTGNNIIGSYVKNTAGENWTTTPKIQFWVKSDAAPSASGATVKIGIEEIEGSNAGTEQWDLRDAYAITPTTTWTQYTFDINETNFGKVYGTGTQNGTLDITQVSHVRFVVLKNSETNTNLSVFFDEAMFGDAALPVELTSFTASAKGNAVSLQWQTATEVNNYGFEVERIRNYELGIRNWEKVGFVNGNGNSNSEKSYSFVDQSATSGKYAYRLKQIDNDGTFKYSKEIEVSLNQPLKFALEQNFPNPFNPSTVIKYELPFDSKVVIRIYNTIGQEVQLLKNDIVNAGNYEETFNASSLPSGIYLYKLTAQSLNGKENFASIKKMILLK